MSFEHWKAILDCTDISETRGDAVILVTGWAEMPTKSGSLVTCWLL